MIGLGLAIDFSLIVVSRFREELAKRGDAGAAVEVTMATAGRSILYSGVTVMLGMIVLSLLVDLMVIRSISHRRPRRRRDGAPRRPHAAARRARDARAAGRALARLAEARRRSRETEGFWYRWSHAIMRRPWAWLAASLALIVVLAFPVLDLKMLGSTGQAPARRAPSRCKGHRLSSTTQFGDNALNPIQIVLKTTAGRRLHAEVPDRPRQALEHARRRPAREQRDVARDVHGRRAARRPLRAPEGRPRLLAGARSSRACRRTSRRRASS